MKILSNKRLYRSLRGTVHDKTHWENGKHTGVEFQLLNSMANHSMRFVMRRLLDGFSLSSRLPGASTAADS